MPPSSSPSEQGEPLAFEWTEQAPGVWSLRFGEADPITPLALLSLAPRREALEAMGAAAFPAGLEAPEIEMVSGNTVIRLPLASEESLFGLGLQFFKVNQRGRTRYLRVNSDPRQDTGETHAPVPFLVSNRGYGVLVNTARMVTFYCGSCQRRRAEPTPTRDRSRDPAWEATPTAEAIEIVVPGAQAELFVFAGTTLLDVVRRYNLFCGGGTLPPRWGLGFWHRVHYQHTDAQTLEEAREFRRRDFPCDVIGLEPGWQSKSYPCSFEWDAERFPDPAGFLQQMRGEGFQVNLWEHGYVSPAAAIYPELEPLSGSHTVWGGLVPDLTLPEARAILQRQHEAQHVAPGVSGYKLDECDGSELTGSSWMFPAQATFPSGCDGERMRQVYGLLLQKLTLEIFRKHDRRTYGLVRASSAGASSLPYVLYSDLYNHREFVRALCNSGFSGLLWTPEIRTAASAEEWVRRMQVVCFSPLAMLNAWSDATKPWSFPDVEPIIRHYLQLRMRLLPYFYSAFARYYFDGTPPFRALALELDGNATEDGASELAREGACDDQYIAGDSLLIAPLFAGETSRKVYLPADVWYDFDNGQRFEGGQTVTITLPTENGGLGKLPVFVREGGIIPLMPPLAHAPRAGEVVPLEIRHYGTKPGRFALFDDDGETFAYERGAYVWRVLEVEVAADGTRQGRCSAPPDGWTSAYGEIPGPSWVKRMPLPEFREDGWLPRGHHQATREEIESLFGGQPGSQRAKVLSNLLHWRDAIRAKKLSGLLILNGSFISQKVAPGDFDCIFVYDEIGLEILKSDLEAQALLNYTQCKTDWQGDIFAFAETALRRFPQMSLFDMFDNDKRTGMPKGCVSSIRQSCQHCQMRSQIGRCRRQLVRT